MGLQADFEVTSMMRTPEGKRVQKIPPIQQAG